MVDLGWFRRRQQRQLTLNDKPARERHILSIMCSCLSILLLILALSLQEWGKADAGSCHFVFKLTEVVVNKNRCSSECSSERVVLCPVLSRADHLLHLPFLPSSPPISLPPPSLPLTVTKYYTTSQQILISCVISVSALAMVSSIIATVISSGFPREKMEFLRHYAVFNIVSRMWVHGGQRERSVAGYDRGGMHRTDLMYRMKVTFLVS